MHLSRFSRVLTIFFFLLACFGGKKGPEADSENPCPVPQNYRTCYEFFFSAYDHIICLGLTVFGTTFLITLLNYDCSINWINLFFNHNKQA